MVDRPRRRRETSPAAADIQLDLFAPETQTPPTVPVIPTSSMAVNPGTSTAGAKASRATAPALFETIDPFHQQLARCQSLEELAAFARSCQRCRLRGGCRQVVFGEGDPHAQLLIIGEGPGATEDELGRPFVGLAGQLLDRMLAATGFARDEVYITNTVKCRPPGNRVPAPDEIATCFPYLEAQIHWIRPKVILCLGSPALQTMVGPTARITRDHGKWFNWRGIPVIATFHPAALLRDPGKKPLAWQDLQEMRRRFLELGGSMRGKVGGHSGAGERAGTNNG